MKLLLTGVFIVLLSLFFYSPAEASILTIDKTGDIRWNVLSIEDSIALQVPEKSEIEVQQVAGQKESGMILLKKDAEKIVLNVGDSRTLDVTNWDNELIEIEERGDVKKISISIKDGKFAVKEGSVTAHTDYPININSRENELSVTTSTGSVFLSVLPQEAAETALRSKYITKVLPDGIELVEKDLGVLTYNIQGEKEINLLNMFDFKIPVKTYISTTTGEVLHVDQPKWLSVVGFLLG